MKQLIFSARTAALCLAGMAAVAMSQAQQNDTLDLDVTFVGDRELLIQDAHKLLTWPKPADLGIEKPTFSYTILPKRLNVTPELEPIDPTRLNVDPPLPRLYRGYVRAGMGRYVTPMIEASVTDLRSRKGTWGAFGEASSTNGGFVDAPTDSVAQRFANMGMELWGEKHFRKAVLRGEGHARRDVISNFAPMDSGVGRAGVGYSDLGLKASIRSIKRDSTDGHLMSALAFNNFRDTADLREQNLRLDGGYFTYRENNRLRLQWDLMYDQLALTPDSTRDSFVIGISPDIRTQKGPLSVEVGAGIYVDARGAQVFHFYPKAEVELVVLKGVLVPYARLGGRVKARPYFEQFQEMPWLQASAALPAEYQKFNIEAGLRGNITDAFHYHVRAFSRRDAQHPYYALDSTSVTGGDTGIGNSGGFITTRIDTLTTGGFGGTATLRLGNDFELIGDVCAYTYGLSNQADPWGLPQLELDFQARYNLAGKFIFTAGAWITDARPGLSLLALPEAEAISNDNAFRTDLGRATRVHFNVEYRYTERLSGWVHLSNLTASSYFLAPGLPVQGFQAMLGASYSF
jgi:hypothetical protein